MDPATAATAAGMLSCCVCSAALRYVHLPGGGAKTSRTAPPTTSETAGISTSTVDHAKRDGAPQLLAQQADLRLQILRITQDFPPSFLYDDEQRDMPDKARQLAGFQTFVRHIKQVLETSPRSQKLQQVQAALQVRYGESTVAGRYMRELYSELGCPAAATAIDLLDARQVRLADKGKAYRKWQRYRKVAVGGGQLDEQLLANVRAGKRAKLLKGGGKLAEIEDELNQFMDQLLAGRSKLLRPQLQPRNTGLRWRPTRCTVAGFS